MRDYIFLRVDIEGLIRIISLGRVLTENLSEPNNLAPLVLSSLSSW